MVEDGKATGYILDEQVGFLMRKATQRHLAIFAGQIPDLTPTQFAALAKLCEKGPSAQNALGRATAMDAATIKGVVDRLTARGLTKAEPDPGDGRRLNIALTEEGRAVVARAVALALDITEATLSPLNSTERQTLVRLLEKLK